MSDEVTISEMQESFDIKQRLRHDTSWAKDVELTNGAGVMFKGRLRWSDNYGYEMFWDGAKPEMADRPEFEYVLDSILEEVYG